MYKVFFYRDGKVVQTVVYPSWTEARDEAYDYALSYPGGRVSCFANHMEARA